MNTIRSTGELYAHAIAIEREASQRYGELAERMEELGFEAVAEVFLRLSQLEAEHLAALERRTAGMALPAVMPGSYRWFDAPESLLLTPRQALLAALDAEYRAHTFFETVCMSAVEAALRDLAQEMALEEDEHIALIERLLEDAEEEDSASPPGLDAFDDEELRP